MKVTVQNGAIQLFSFVDEASAERVTTTAKLPANMAEDWNGQALNLIDWRIQEDRKTVKLEYQARDDVYAPILDATLPCEVVRAKLAPPNRSKNWVWKNSYWFNTKTGEKSYSF